MAELSEWELTQLLKDKLLLEIKKSNPQTLRDFRLLAIRMADRLSHGDNDLKNTVYDALTELMGIGSKTAKEYGS